MQLRLASFVALFAAAARVSASYAPSCYNEYLTGVVLNAMCYNRAGQPVDTSLDLNNCVANYDGNLNCVHGSGEYSATCNVGSCILYGGEYLQCQCSGGSGGSSTVDLGSCIDNQNGQLAC